MKYSLLIVDVGKAQTDSHIQVEALTFHSRKSVQQIETVEIVVLCYS